VLAALALTASGFALYQYVLRVVLVVACDVHARSDLVAGLCAAQALSPPVAKAPPRWTGSRINFDLT